MSIDLKMVQKQLEQQIQQSADAIMKARGQLMQMEKQHDFLLGKNALAMELIQAGEKKDETNVSGDEK